MDGALTGGRAVLLVLQLQCQAQHLYMAYCYHLELSVVHSFSEKAMAPYSSTLAWQIPWAEEPDRLQSMGSLRVGHD